MKPRTKTEKEVARLSALLPDITKAQAKWLRDNANPANAYTTKREMWCASCGHVMAAGETRCPHCGRVFTNIVKSRNTTEKDKKYATIHTARKGYQIARHFVVWRESRKGKETQYQVNEAVQEWIDGNGVRTVMARSVAMNTWYYDVWSFGSEMSIKHDPPMYSRGYGKYNIYSYANKWESLLPMLKRNGATRTDIGTCPSTLYQKLLANDTFAEELLKTRQHNLLSRYCRDYRSDIPRHAVRICNRNGYIVRDADLWCDYIDMLDRLGLDTHNAHYVCPTNLQAAHDRLAERINRHEKEIQAKEDRQKARQAEELYRQLHAKYLAIFFGNDDINISVAQTVEDIRQEGEAMHHCVFAANYYKKENSLILFARDKQGNRIETIEIDLKNFKVAQSRGVCNSMTPQHDAIIRLCNENMHLIKAAA